MFIAQYDQESLEGAYRVLRTMYPSKKENDRTPYLSDYAHMLCFLSDRRAFEVMYFDMSDFMDRQFKFLKVDMRQDNALTRGFNDMFDIIDAAAEGRVGCQFKRSHQEIVVKSDSDLKRYAQNISLTGGARVIFPGIVMNGYLFKDGTGPSHGEYAHSIQWLVLAFACYYGRLRLDNPLITLYKSCVGPGSLSAKDQKRMTLDPDTDKLAEVNPPLWSLLVDCFRTSELYGLPEDLEKNLFVENYRSPSYLTDQMLHRRLSTSYLGQLLRARYENKKRGFVTGAHEREKMHKYYKDKQRGLNAMVIDDPDKFSTFPTQILDKDEALRKEISDRLKK